MTTKKTTTAKTSTKKTTTAKSTSAKTTTPKDSSTKTSTAKAKTTTAKSTSAKTTTPKATTAKNITAKATTAKTTKKSTTTAKKATNKTTTSKTAKADIKIYQLKITLKGVRPPIWRRVLVKSNTTFDQLHFIIQRSMDWGGYHLYGWEVKGREYTGQNTIFAELGFFDDEATDKDHEFDEKEIGAIIGEKVNTKFVYIYDFGDNWEHEILVEEILPVDPKIKKYPICITGKRAAPPDDCGGSWGYQELLEILKDPEHPEYEEYMDWVEEDFDPEYCSLEEINIRLMTLNL